MARPKKTQTTPTSEATNSANEVSVKELWDVLNFSRNLISGMYPGILTPDLLNTRLKEISYTPSALSEENLAKALADPKNSEESLRSMVEYMELISRPFARIIDYLQSQLSFDWTYVVKNVKNPEEYTSPAFKKDQGIVFDWIDRFDYQTHFRSMVRQLLRNEMYVCSVRDEGQQIVLQELPLQYCRPVSKWDYGYTVAFNFAYFLQPGTDLRLFPRFFAEKFNDLFGGKSDISKYQPYLNPELRGDSQFVYWVDLPPKYGFVFKLDPSLNTIVPKMASLIPDLINQPVIRSLQKNMYMSAASKMLIGQVPMLKDAKTKIADMIAIDSTTLGKFLALVKSALSESLKVAAAPLEQIQALSFDSDDELYDSYLRTAVSASGVNSSLIYSGKLKANAVESQLSFQSDSLNMEQNIYPQCNGFMNYFLNKETKKYRYMIEFEGNAYYLDRKQRFDSAMTLANMGIFLPQKIAAASGMKPYNLIRMMEESKANGYVDKLLTPIVSAFQQSGKPGEKPGEGEKGRPAKSDSELGEEGSNTRDSGANISKGGNL